MSEAGKTQEWLTQTELAKLLRINRNTLTREIEAGRIPYLAVSIRVRRFNFEQVQAALLVPAKDAGTQG